MSDSMSPTPVPSTPSGEGDPRERVEASPDVSDTIDRVEATLKLALERSSDFETLMDEVGGEHVAARTPLMRPNAAQDDAGEVIERMVTPNLDLIVSQPKPDEAGERIGNYKLLEQIGEGGFGVVWVANQEAPVRRRVALKIVKLGMDTRQVIARFEQERQALAMMDHPNIAKVFDAGSTPTGRPFFVMELVRGIKITDYCDQMHLPTEDRLKLFITVCQAVQHAHQKGIIHRDIKPSNILVTLHDGVAVPKVIDFGVAKATQQQRLTDLTIYTQFEQMIGTPLYMSPEQAEMSGLDVDTRSDIYSLGVVLYELLTGRTPFDPHQLMSKGLDEIRRTIREEEPAMPSAVLHTMALEFRTSVARDRQADPGKLLNLIRGDLDWIVMKALEKDRSRRYETAIELAKDIERHLAHEPVHARPPTQLYRLRRLVRRNRLTFAAGGAVAAALVIGLGVATNSLINERKARRSEEEQRQIAQRQGEEARISAARAEASEFKATHLLYATDMHLVQEALRANNIGLARQLLDRHRPENGRPDLRDWEWRYLYQECRSASRATITRYEGVPVTAASYSPDGTLLVIGFSDGRVELWNVPTRKLQKLIQAPVERAARAVFSPGGENIVSTAAKGVVKTVDVKTGGETVLCTVEGSVRDLSYSRDGEWVAVLSESPDRLLVFRVADRGVVMSHTLPRGGGMFFNNARISPDKQRLYVSCGAFRDPTVQCVSVPDARVLWEYPIGIIDESERDSGRDTGFSAMDLSPDGRTLVVSTGYRDPNIRIIDTASGQLLGKRRGHSKYVLQVAFSDDGRILASTSEDQTVGLWDTATWTKLMAPLRGHNLEVSALAMSKDGRFLASGGKDGEVLLWDISVPPPVGGRRVLPSRISKVIPLAVSRMVLGQSRERQWSLFDLPTLAEEPLPPSDLLPDGSYPGFVPQKSRPPRPAFDKSSLGLSGSVGAQAVSPDGKLLVLTSESGEIGFYDAASLAKIEIIRSNLRSVFGIAFSPDGRRLVLSSGGEEGIAVWDPSLRQELLMLPSNYSLLSDLGFTDDGNTIIVRSKPVGTGGGACEFWQAPSFQEIDEAERSGGRWPQPEAFRKLPPAPTLAELKVLLEVEYKRRLVRSGEESPAPIGRRQEAMENLATLLHQEGRDAEADPLFRELIENLQRGVPQDETTILAVTKKLLSVVLGQIQTERHQPGKLIDRSVQADALVDEILAISARQSLAHPEKTLDTLKLAGFQFWLGRKAEYFATYRRLMERAEQYPADAYASGHAAIAWCLDPAGDSNSSGQVLRLAQYALESAKDDWETAWVQRTLALTNYRAGNYTGAEQALIPASEAVKHFDGSELYFKESFQASLDFIRSMILFRIGYVEEAHTLFATGEKKMKPLPPDERQILESNSAFHEVMVWLAYKEAKALLDGEGADVAAKPR